MIVPSFPDAFEVLCLQAADSGRGPALFGDSLARARSLARPFMVGSVFPSVYLEFPLLGDPALDVTVLYGSGEPQGPIQSEATAGTDELVSWYIQASKNYEDVSFGFELDTSKPELPAAGIHFQPRIHHELVGPFCTQLGEPERAALYLDLASRMPEGWKLSFFGMFRGRPHSPLRVCGYLGAQAARACKHDAQCLVDVFDQIGFSAYDETMIEQVRAMMAAAPSTIDFQFDIYPDGHLGEIFALDTMFGVSRPEKVREKFATGKASQVMRLLEDWQIADDRWKLGVEATFAVGLPTEDGDHFTFTLMPQWAKTRWTGGHLQPSKLYMLGKAGILSQ